MASGIFLWKFCKHIFKSCKPIAFCHAKFNSINQPKPNEMKTLKIKLMLVILLSAFSHIACEHCDPEDYEREERERTENVVHTDSVAPETAQLP